MTNFVSYWKLTDLFSQINWLNWSVQRKNLEKTAKKHRNQDPSAELTNYVSYFISFSWELTKLYSFSINWPQFWAISGWHFHQQFHQKYMILMKSTFLSSLKGEILYKFRTQVGKFAGVTNAVQKNARAPWLCGKTSFLPNPFSLFRKIIVFLLGSVFIRKNKMHLKIFWKYSTANFWIPLLRDFKVVRLATRGTVLATRGTVLLYLRIES